MALTATKSRESGSVGPRLDAYRMLCLHSSAPRELIEGAYWSHVVRLRQESHAEARTTAMDLRALNEAYATLIDRGPSTQGNPLHAPAVSGRAGGSPGRSLRRKATAGGPPDYYAVLAVSPEADATLMELAYEVRRRRFAIGAQSQEARLVDEAHRTLADPAARAAYDARYGFSRPDEPAPAAVPPADEERITAHARAAWSDEPEAGAPPVELADEPRYEAEANASEPTSVGQLREAARRALRRPRLSRPMPPLAEAPDENEPYARGVDALPLAGFDSSTAKPNASARADGYLVFSDGPRTGEAIALTGEPMVLGSGSVAGVVLASHDRSIRETHARIWRHNGRYILHQVDQFSPVTLNDELLGLRLAVLDDGDRLRIASYTLRFERARE